MTTQACNLPLRIQPGPMKIRRSDGTPYIEYDEAEIARMIAAGIVEGIGPRSGRIDALRMLCSEEEALVRISSIPLDRSRFETPGTITSMASREVYREALGESGCWAWNFKSLRNMSAVSV